MSQHQAKIKTADAQKVDNTNSKEFSFDKKNLAEQKQFSGADDSTEPNWASVQARMNLPGQTASKNFPEKSQPVQRKVPANTNPLSTSTYSSQQTNYQPASNPRTGMPATVQHKMETAFNTSFDDVKIHVGSQAKKLGALAFTQGNHIHFAPGQYNPHSQKGQELLGHELAHVVQQRQGRVQEIFQAKDISINDNSALEKEADYAGKKIAQGNTQLNLNYYDLYSNVNASSKSFQKSSTQPIQAKFFYKKEKENYEFKSVEELLSYAKIELNDLIRSDLPTDVGERLRKALELSIEDESQNDTFDSPEDAKRYIEGLINDISHEKSPISNLYGNDVNYGEEEPEKEVKNNEDESATDTKAPLANWVQNGNYDEIIQKFFIHLASREDYINFARASKKLWELAHGKVEIKLFLQNQGFEPKNSYYNPIYGLHYLPDKTEPSLEGYVDIEFSDLLNKRFITWLPFKTWPKPSLQEIIESKEVAEIIAGSKVKLEASYIFLELAARSEFSLLRKTIRNNEVKVKELISNIENAPGYAKQEAIFPAHSYFNQLAALHLARTQQRKLKAFDKIPVDTRHTSDSDNELLLIDPKFAVVQGGDYPSLKNELEDFIKGLPTTQTKEWKDSCFIDYLLEPIQELGKEESRKTYEDDEQNKIMKMIRTSRVCIKAKFLVRSIESFRHEGVFTANLLGLLANKSNKNYSLDILLEDEHSILSPEQSTNWYNNTAQFVRQIGVVHRFLTSFLKSDFSNFSTYQKIILVNLQSKIAALFDDPNDKETQVTIVNELIKLNAYQENLPFIVKQETSKLGELETYYRQVRQVRPSLEDTIIRKGEYKRKPKGKGKKSTNLIEFDDTPASKACLDLLFNTEVNFLAYVLYYHCKGVQTDFFNFCAKFEKLEVDSTKKSKAKQLKKPGDNFTPKMKEAILQRIGFKIPKRPIKNVKKGTITRNNWADTKKKLKTDGALKIYKLIYDKVEGGKFTDEDTNKVKEDSTKSHRGEKRKRNEGSKDLLGQDKEKVSVSDSDVKKEDVAGKDGDLPRGGEHKRRRIVYEDINDFDDKISGKIVKIIDDNDIESVIEYLKNNNINEIVERLSVLINNAKLTVSKILEFLQEVETTIKDEEFEVSAEVLSAIIQLKEFYRGFLNRNDEVESQAVGQKRKGNRRDEISDSHHENKKSRYENDKKLDASQIRINYMLDFLARQISSEVSYDNAIEEYKKHRKDDSPEDVSDDIAFLETEEGKVLLLAQIESKEEAKKEEARKKEAKKDIFSEEEWAEEEEEQHKLKELLKEFIPPENLFSLNKDQDNSQRNVLISLKLSAENRDFIDVVLNKDSEVADIGAVAGIFVNELSISEGHTLFHSYKSRYVELIKEYLNSKK